MDLSQLLQQARQGNQEARSNLVRLAYVDLQRIARQRIKRQRPGHTLTATALVHEVTIRLLEKSHVPCGDSNAFLSYVATAMRRVLIDHARGRNRVKRGGGGEKIQLTEALTAAEQQPDELLALDEALQRLAEIDPRRARVVEMRYFAGMEIDEIATALSVSAATVKRDWQVARLWLARELGREDKRVE
jgi:RNA polymerase sigma factor (TIGR02999 family)